MSRLVWLALWSWPAAADDFYVAPSGSDTGNDCTTAGTPCATVAKALSSTATIGTAPHTVHLADGEYESTTAYPLVVPGGVSLQGASRAGTILDANGAIVTVVDLGYVGSPNGLSSLTIQGGDRAIEMTVGGESEHVLTDLDLTASGQVIRIASDHGDLSLTLDDARIHGGANGLYFVGSGALDLTLSSTTIEGATTTGVQADFVSSTSTGDVRITLEDATIKENGQGIWAHTQQGPGFDVEISGVHATIDDNVPGPGIALTGNIAGSLDAAMAFEQGSHMGGNSLAGIRLRGGDVSGSVDLDDSVFSGNEGGAIFFDGQLDRDLEARVSLVNDSHIDQNGSGITFSGGMSEPSAIIELTDSSIDLNAHDGVRVRFGAAENYVSEVTLTSSTISGNGDSDLLGNGVLLLKDGVGDGTVDLILQNSAISDNASQGFGLNCSGCSGSADLTIALSGSSEISNNAEEGIYALFGGSLDLDVIESDVSGNGKGGIILRDNPETDTLFCDVTLTDASLTGNGFENLRGGGLSITHTSGGIESTITATGVSFDGNAGDALLLAIGDDFEESLVLDECTFVDNAGDTDGASGVHVNITGDSQGTFELTGQGLTFERNSTTGIRVEDFADGSTELSVVLEDVGFFDNDRHGLDVQTSHGDLVLGVVDSDFAGNVDAIDVKGGSGASIDLDVHDVSMVGHDTAVSAFVATDGTLLADLGQLTIEGGQAGLVFGGGQDGFVDVDLTDMTMTDLDLDGIRAVWSGDSSGAGFLRFGIEDVEIPSPGRYGLFVEPEGRVAVQADLVGTTITDAGDAGIRILGVDDAPVGLTVRDSHIANNGFEGIAYRAAGGVVRLEGNVITGNVRDGLRSAGGAQRSAVLRNNTLADNADGYVTTSYFDVAYADAALIDARENWWGTSDPAVVAEHVSGGVEFSVFPDALLFTPATTTAPETGGTAVALVADDTSGPFHLRSGDLALTVLFGSTPSPAVGLSEDARTLVAEVPPGTGTVTITVTNPGGQVGTASFTYVPEDEFLDADADGVEDGVDNCASVGNVSQANHDTDATGDACDTDDDGDGVLDGADVCPTVSDAGQADLDDDDIGDVCDPDDDGDTVVDVDDDCPRDVDPQQEDADDDGIGDACDIDADGDGIPDRDEVDTDDTATDDTATDDTGGDDTGPRDRRCGCATESAPALWPALLGLLALRRRRTL